MFKCKYGYSIYMDCFKAGARGTPWGEIEKACSREGIVIRRKDYDNYQRGLRASNHKKMDTLSPSILYPAGASNTFFEMKYTDYPKLPDGWKESDIRFFPAEGSGAKPLKGWRWGTHLTTRQAAEAISPVGLYGENLLGCTHICLDIDGDHSDIVDEDLLRFATPWKKITEYREARPTSFHLIFETDRIIPIMHWSFAHMDLIGNKSNAALYFKDKQIYNHENRVHMDDELWERLKSYIIYRKKLSE